MSDIERRLKDLEDRTAIHDLVVGYFLAVDSDNFDEINRIFSDDATFSLSGVVVGSGRKNIVEYLVAARKMMGLTVHTPNYVLPTRKDGNMMTGVVGAHLELVLGDEAVFGAVRYEGMHPFYTPGKGLDLFWRRVMLPLLGAAVAASSSRAIIRRSALLDGQAVLPRRRRARLEGRHRSFYKFRSA